MGAAKGTYDKVLELLGNIKGKRSLDCGAGKGAFTKQLIRRNGDVYACDIDRNRFKLNIPFREANFDKKIPFRNSFFDGVVSIEVIEHLENPAIFIKELSRILRKNGELIITTPNIQNVKSKLQFLFNSEFHWFQESEFGDNGSKHVSPLYWRELLFLLKKYGFRVNRLTTNRTSKYTLYYTNRDRLFKKCVYGILNFISDALYRILSIFMFPKDKALLFGDILIIKAIKDK